MRYNTPKSVNVNYQLLKSKHFSSLTHPPHTVNFDFELPSLQAKTGKKNNKMSVIKLWNWHF